MADILLGARDVAIERGYRCLLKGLNLDVEQGQLVQLAGANGVGKTSLLRALAGLGRFGVTGHISRPQALLYLGHLPSTKPTLTPVENLRWHPSGRVAEDDQAIVAALAAVSLTGYEDTPIHHLSAGQQRRVALARLWLSTEPLWLLDEPFTAIDVLGAALLEARLVEHADQGGAVVFTSHQPNRFGDRLQVLDLTQYAA